MVTNWICGRGVSGCGPPVRPGSCGRQGGLEDEDEDHGTDTAGLLAGTTFKCTGAAAELLKTAVTDQDMVVLLVDFYRAGDGNDESLTAQMIVSAGDISTDIAGFQNVWIQVVGCTPAIANF